MLTGTADLDSLAARAPVMESLDVEPVRLEEVEVLQAVFEQGYQAREATLPAGLHPTTPPLLVLLAWNAPDSPWGPFAMAQARVSCRSGVRPRGFVSGCIVDNPVAASALASGWGLPAAPGTVGMKRRYDGSELVVHGADAGGAGGRAGSPAVHLVALDPDPLGPDDVQFTVSTTLASTPRGLRLVQVEPEYELRRVERVRPRLAAFDAQAWGAPLLDPRHPVSATVSVGAVTIPRLRFLSRADLTAFEGTEKI